MSDYNMYNFTLEEADLLRVLKQAAVDGCKPCVIINGMYYDINLNLDGYKPTEVDF